MQAILDRLLRRFIVAGTLNVLWHDGTRATYGEGAPRICIQLTTSSAARRLVTDPSLAMGELYMEQALRPIGCTIYDFLDLVGANLRAAPGAFTTNALAIGLGKLLRRLDQFNPLARARRNVAHHYDLNGRLYGLFLDADRQYSCAYYATGRETLEQAQAAKKRHIAAKLRLERPGLRVLDIGSGWGGMALSLARDYDCHVDGITLSREQLVASETRAREAGLAGQVRFRLMDYRDVEDTYDRIVSVGMFEHVGVNHYGSYFATLHRCLVPDGVALLHTIGRSDGPLSTNRWVKKYVFPGGYAPAVSEILPQVERSGLIITDVEVLRLHYAHTLRAWRERFATQRDTIAGLYDERFCRMFEFYLAISEMSFRRLTHVNFQLQLTRGPHALPLTRDYMRHAEHLPQDGAAG